MIVGYGELELTFCHCAGLVLGQPFAVLDALHQVRSEGAKIAIADALARNEYTKLRIANEYAEALGALKHCLKIRNQYAHSHFRKSGKRLSFFNPDEKTYGDLDKPFAWKPTSIPLLREHAALFAWTRAMLIWLELSLPRFLEGKATPFARPKPRKKPLPPLQIDSSRSPRHRSIARTRRQPKRRARNPR